MESESTATISIKLPTDLLSKVDARARSVDLNRGQFFRALVRAALNEPLATQAVLFSPGAVVLGEAPKTPAAAPVETVNGGAQ